MGSTKSHSTIVFEKNKFYPGEDVVVRLICDNSECDKAITGFKLELNRQHCGEDNSEWVTTGSV